MSKDIETKRNKQPQFIKNPKTGETKIIFHEKKMNGVEYGSHKEWWNSVNKSASPNSKRQKLLDDTRRRNREDSVVNIS